MIAIFVGQKHLMHSFCVYDPCLTWSICIKKWVFSLGNLITGKHHLFIKLNSVTQYLLKRCLVSVGLSPGGDRVVEVDVSLYTIYRLSPLLVC